MNNSNSPIKIIILLVVVLVGGYWFYTNSGNAPEGEQVLSKVADKVLVPTDVTPKIVELTTLEQLRGQNFFKQAALGDQIIMYPESVILYRPQIDKIITIGALDPTVSAQIWAEGSSSTSPDGVLPPAPATTPTPTDPNQQATPGAVTVTPVSNTPVGVEIRNGTATSGLAKKLSAKLTVDPMVTVPVTGNARDTSYAKTTIVNLTGASLPASIAGVVKNAEVVTALPAGEKPIDANAKVLVIIGADISSKVDNL